MRKIYCIGEMLFDVFAKNSKDANLEYIFCPGGAPANVSVQCANLGVLSCFIGGFSDDALGVALQNCLKEHNVTVLPCIVKNVNTALAFVMLKDGERSFKFYRNMTADMLLEPKFIDTISFSKDDILHFCSISLCDCPAKNAHKVAIKRVKAAKGEVSFDVNVRKSLFENEKVCKDAIYEFLPYADILKLSEEELYFLTDLIEEKIATEKILSIAKSCKILLITKGERGASVYKNGELVLSVKAKNAAVVDTTAAGDSFIGGFLSYLALNDISAFNISNNQLCDAMELASKVAAITVSREGSIPSLAKWE